MFLYSTSTVSITQDVVVDTPQGIPYHGRRLAPNTQICGVSILRAGEAFEPSLTSVCKDVRLGKILIQTNPETLEPELHYLRLPSDIKVVFFTFHFKTTSLKHRRPVLYMTVA